MESIFQDLTVDERSDLLDLLESASEIGTWDWDIGENTFRWSRGQYRLFGLDPGLGTDLTYEHWLAAIHRDDRKALQAATADSIASGRDLDVTYRVLRREESLGKVDVRWLHARGCVVRSEDDRPLRMIGTCRDVTEREEYLARVRAERDAELADRFGGQSRFDLLFDATRDCLVQLKVEGPDRFTYQQINAAGLKMIDMTMAAARGLTPREVLGEVNGGQMEEALASVVATGLPVHYEPTFTYGGTTVLYDAIYMPLRDEHGTVAAILCRARDVTEARRNAEALRQAQKMDVLGHMAAGITHDFNNVLTSLKACFLRLARISDAPETDRILELGSQAIRQGEAVTQRLLTFVHRRPSQFAPICLNDCIREALPLLRASVPQAQITFDDDDPRCWGVADPGLLHACLLNLCLNSRDACPEGCEITISTLGADADFVPCDPSHSLYAGLCVRDNGPGMPPDVAARAWEPLFTTKELGKGTGLGLSMVYGTAQSFGGTVRMDTAPGRGTAITMYLPCA
ncbi:MAG TPA: ATP-binding protein [Sphingomonas sp.]|nr:ATP-binding protein [Sphingomonas sp.]